MANETWFILEDETPADPRDVAQDKNGKLRHRDGRAVAYAPHGPRSRSVDAEVERSKSRQPKPKIEALAVVPAATATGAATAGTKPTETETLGKATESAQREMRSDENGLKYKTRT